MRYLCIYAYMENMANWGYLRYTKSSPNMRRVFKRIRRIRGKNLCVHGEDAKRLLAYFPYSQKDTKMCIYRLIIISILTFLDSFYPHYCIWDGLSQKTISRYCPFNAYSLTRPEHRCSLAPLSLSVPYSVKQSILMH
jgi:hypothetical protein